MIDRIKREPAVLIGVIAAVILAVVQTLAGQGIVGQDLADTIFKALDPTSGWLIPLALGIVTRFFVTSASAPAVKEGTVVTVITPSGQPNVTAPISVSDGEVVAGPTEIAA